MAWSLAALGWLWGRVAAAARVAPRQRGGWDRAGLEHTQRRAMPPTGAAALCANTASAPSKPGRETPFFPSLWPKLCLVTPSPQQLPHSRLESQATPGSCPAPGVNPRAHLEAVTALAKPHIRPSRRAPPAVP